MSYSYMSHVALMDESRHSHERCTTFFGLQPMPGGSQHPAEAPYVVRCLVEKSPMFAGLFSKIDPTK